MSAASEDGSCASSCDSEEFGQVARAGFTKMYVLTYSSESPLASDLDDDRGLESDSDDEAEAKEHADAKASHGDAPRHREQYEDLEAAFSGRARGKYQLLYASGKHYFHGVISVPDCVGTLRTVDQDEDNEEQEDKQEDKPMTRRKKVVDPESVSFDDLDVLLPHFQAQQDSLTSIADIQHFREELRDVLYQMEEVGEFMVEELCKDKIIKRIEQGSKHMQWMTTPDNPTFFELQTYPQAQSSFRDAGVLLIVMKVVLRGVLLDVLYHQDKYVAVLRENAGELALEDTFVPDVAHVGPCYTVRQYKDGDLKKLVLWCAFPRDMILYVEKKAESTDDSASPRLATDTLIPAKTMPRVLRVAPASSSVLDANDTQLYCLFASASGSDSNSKTKGRGKSKSKSKDSKDNEGTTRQSQDAAVVFQFNEFLYEGRANLELDRLNDLSKLSTVILPDLQAQAARSLTYRGTIDEVGNSAASDSRTTSTVPQSLRVKRVFASIARTLLDLVVDSQAWVQHFLDEVAAVASESSWSTTKATWLNTHLRAWLEQSDGSEFFYELSLTDTPRQQQQLWGDITTDIDSHLELLLWKGIVHQAVLLIVYRAGSFFIMLRNVEDLAAMPAQPLEYFALLPELGRKGRGYLVRAFPTARDLPEATQSWLANAKLMLWQTSASVEREEAAAEDAQAKWTQDEQAQTTAWLERKSPHSESKADNLRPSMRLDDDSDKPVDDSSSSPGKSLRVGKQHHVAPLPKRPLNAAISMAAAPWDLRTGRPL